VGKLSCQTSNATTVKTKSQYKTIARRTHKIAPQIRVTKYTHRSLKGQPTSHATIGLHMDSADDVYITVWQSGLQGAEDQKLYFKRGASPFLPQVSFCSTIVVYFMLFKTAVDHGTQYIFDMIHINCIISTIFFLTV